MKNIIAVSTNSFHGFDIMETLETIAKAGFTANGVTPESVGAKRKGDKK